MNYYNDNDPFCCAWIKELIYEGLIPRGDVDSRDIRNIPPGDLRGYVGVHLFAGIGGWAYALRMAGWPDSKPVWSGSCPCQPFSVAGKGAGLEDERHLWPAFRWLIAQCRPEVVVGEQVASIDGVNWLTGVYDDLEAIGYTVPTNGNGLHELYDIPAAGLGAPHIRQRLFWVGIAKGVGLQKSRQKHGCPSEPSGCAFRVADLQHQRLKGGLRRREDTERENIDRYAGCSGTTGGVADAPNDNRRPGECGTQAGVGQDGIGRRGSASGGSDGEYGGDGSTGGGRVNPGVEVASRRFNSCGPLSQTKGFWSNSTLIPCADGKWRRVSSQPEIFPLAPRLPNRVGILRGAGNAIVPQVAATFIKAFLETTE